MYCCYSLLKATTGFSIVDLNSLLQKSTTEYFPIIFIYAFIRTNFTKTLKTRFTVLLYSLAFLHALFSIYVHYNNSKLFYKYFHLNAKKGRCL